jgi:hypothetical protein
MELERRYIDADGREITQADGAMQRVVDRY